MNDYIDLCKSLAKVQQQLREYRLRTVLMLLLNKTNKSRQLKAAELVLNLELSKELQSQIAVDEAITELEILLADPKQFKVR